MSTSSSARADARTRLSGASELERALDAGLPVRCVVVPEGTLPGDLAALCDRAAAAGAEIVRTAERRHALRPDDFVRLVFLVHDGDQTRPREGVCGLPTLG